MFSSLLVEARIWRLTWRQRLADRFLGAGEALTLLLMMGLPAACVAGIVGFAYWNGTQDEPALFEAKQLQTTRAMRRAEDLECLAENVYFEARGEPLEGQFAVAEVTLNRTEARNFPHTVCGVVHETRWDPGRR